MNEKSVCLSILKQYRYLLNKQQVKAFKKFIDNGDIDSFKSSMSKVIKKRYNI